jgi:serine/threonine protein kinase
MKCDYHFDEDDWSSVSEEAKSFVEMLLEGNMYNRMTADQALEHPWVSSLRLSS